MRVLFDTSILVAALIVSHPRHPACFSQLQAAKSKQVQGFISTLNLPGGAIFDALIAQAALKIEVEILLTLNPNHFTRLGEAIANRVQGPE